jgi:Flp pilus assembly protein TadG
VQGRLSSKIASVLQDCRAVSAVEFAVTAPLLIGMLIPLVDLGMGIAKNTQLHNAAQAGAQYALANGWDSTAIQNAVTNATKLSPIEALPAPSQSCGCPTGTTVTAVSCGSVCSDGANAGTYVTVNARSSYTPVIPYPMLGSPVILVATSIVRINQ